MYVFQCLMRVWAFGSGAPTVRFRDKVSASGHFCACPPFGAWTGTRQVLDVRNLPVRRSGANEPAATPLSLQTIGSVRSVVRLGNWLDRSDWRTDADSLRESGEVSQVPGKEHRRLGFDRSSCNQSVVHLSSNDSESRRFSQRPPGVWGGQVHDGRGAPIHLNQGKSIVGS